MKVIIVPKRNRFISKPTTNGSNIISTEKVNISVARERPPLPWHGILQDSSIVGIEEAISPTLVKKRCLPKIIRQAPFLGEEKLTI